MSPTIRITVSPTMRNRIASIIRTLVPIIVGFVLSAAAQAGLDLPAEDVAHVIDTVVIGLYYTAVRWAEDRWPQIGILLGWREAPAYQSDGGA